MCKVDVMLCNGRNEGKKNEYNEEELKSVHEIYLDSLTLYSKRNVKSNYLTAENNLFDVVKILIIKLTKQDIVAEDVIIRQIGVLFHQIRI